ncbi:MAG: acetyl-CoA carboxylase, carboxyltransferase subunit beta [Eubacteriales bacterium]|nr:acetyl-CoA carboxylase, carboxyltransferase subunit beta [Eubacteriales bacterium]
MNIDDIFKQRKKRWNSLINIRKNIKTEQFECPKCKKVTEGGVLKKAKWICGECGYYFKVPAHDRIEMLCDEDSFKEKFTIIATGNPLDFPGYEDKIHENQEKTGLSDAFLAGSARVAGRKIAIGVLDSRFLMGSMGTAVGEKICRLTEYAGKRKIPLIIFSASGGARMQEGLFSLMQMANTSAAVEQFKNAGGLFISYLTNPTTGGVSASYASLGDIIIAEPDALICFAGPRVIKQTIGQTLPEGFQHAEFLLEHGMIDMIVRREEMRDVMTRLLQMHKK